MLANAYSAPAPSVQPIRPELAEFASCLQELIRHDPLLQTPDGKLTDSMPPYLRNLDPDSPEFKERMEAWRFEHDMLQVIVNKPSLLQDCYRFNVSINNEVRWFGGAPTDDAAWNEVHTVPRCFVGQLLQMRAQPLQ